jgi:uncharacterized membrane protein YhaH (DUF805 family)
VGAVFVALLLKLIMAISAGRPFIGTNYYGLPIGTYSTLVVFVVVALIGLFIGVSRLVLAIKRRRSK